MDIDARYKDGKAAMREGDVPRAIECFQSVLSLDENHERALGLLSELHLQIGAADTALKYADRAVAVAPHQAAYQNQRGLIYVFLQRPDDAEEAFNAALELNPSLTIVKMNLAIVYAKKDRLAEAHANMMDVLKRDPNDALALTNLGLIYGKLGRVAEAGKCLDRAYALAPDSLECASNRLGMLHYSNDHATAEVAVRTKHYWQLRDRAKARAKPQTHQPGAASSQKRPLRIGYVSADFRTHPVGRLMKPVLENHRQDHVHAMLYSNNSVEDDTTASLKSACMQWRNISAVSDDDAARSIHADGIDILVDLSGHSDGNRLSVFRHRPAPVQCTWLGFVATTGVEEIDYIIADQHVLAVSDEPHYVEKPLRLPHSLLCYKPPENDSAVRRQPASERASVTFGCFNSIQKLNEGLIQTWARILNQVPGSRMMIKYAHLSNEDIFKSVESLFQENGIDSNRLILRGRTSYEDHMASYNEIDIALDSFPYAGTMTTLETLWMGVPVISRKGSTWASRMGASLLSTAGLPTLIAETEQDYIEKAVVLANDRDARNELHRTLRKTLTQSPLCDVPAFVYSLEELYQNAWETWCQQR